MLNTHDSKGYICQVCHHENVIGIDYHDIEDVIVCDVCIYDYMDDKEDHYVCTRLRKVENSGVN